MKYSQKEFLTALAILLICGYIVVNWNYVSWFLNYKNISGLIFGSFGLYQDDMLVNADNSQIVINDDSQKINNNVQVLSNYKTVTTSNDSLLIPGIGISTDLVIGKSTDLAELEEDLDKGAVYYPGSVLPGNNGHIVILGHSAPPYWPKIKHDYIFSDIHKMNSGDEITLNFNGKKYIYKVLSKNIIDQGQDIGFTELSKIENVLTLVSCWPPGKNYKRIAVTATLVKP